MKVPKDILVLPQRGPAPTTRLRFRRKPSSEDVAERYTVPVVIPPRPGVLLGPHPFTEAIRGLRAWGEGKPKAIAK